MRPQLLGYILDTLVKVMAWIEQHGMIELDKLPRMADWAGYCEIIGRSIGLEEEEFISSYENNAKIQTEQVMETDQIAICIQNFVETDAMFYNDDGDGCDKEVQKDVLGNPLPEWGFEGTASLLKAKLEQIAQKEIINIDIKGKDWPKSASHLSKRINIIKHTLKDAGIEIDSKVSDGGTKKLILIRKLPSLASLPSTEHNQAQKNVIKIT